MTYNVIILLSDRSFAPTEATIPWHYFVEAVIQVTFSKIAQANPRSLIGVIIGQRNNPAATITTYQSLIQAEVFQSPISFSNIGTNKSNILQLTYSHTKEIYQYLERTILHKKCWPT